MFLMEKVGPMTKQATEKMRWTCSQAQTVGVTNPTVPGGCQPPVLQKITTVCPKAAQDHTGEHTTIRSVLPTEHPRTYTWSCFTTTTQMWLKTFRHTLDCIAESNIERRVNFLWMQVINRLPDHHSTLALGFRKPWPEVSLRKTFSYVRKKNTVIAKLLICSILIRHLF